MTDKELNLKELELEIKKTELERARVESTKMDSNDLRDTRLVTGIARWLGLVIITGIVSTTAVKLSNNGLELYKLKHFVQTLNEGNDDGQDSIEVSEQQRETETSNLLREEDSTARE